MGLLTRVTKSEVYSQILLIFRGILGHTRKGAQPPHASKDKAEGSNPMEVDTTKRNLTSRSA